MLTTEFKSFIYQGSESQLNQNLSKQIKGPAAARPPPPPTPQASAKAFVLSFAPSTVWRLSLLLDSGLIHTCPITLLGKWSTTFTLRTWVWAGVGGGGSGTERSKTNGLIAKPAMMSASINVSHRHANQLHDIITASITPVGLQSYSKDNITQRSEPQETSTALSDGL